MLKGKPAIDPKTGESFELHHIGQKADSTLAILTKEEHRLKNNHKIWHKFGEASVVHTTENNWSSQKAQVWKDIGNHFLENAAYPPHPKKVCTTCIPFFLYYS